MMRCFFMVAVALVIGSAHGANSKGSVSIQEHDLQRMMNTEHEIDENVRKFKENLEGLRTTVDFEPITV